MLNSCTVFIHSISLSPKLEQMCGLLGEKPHTGLLLCQLCHQAPPSIPGHRHLPQCSGAPTPAGLDQCRLCLIKNDGTVQLAKPASFHVFISPNRTLLCFLHKKIKKSLYKKSHVSQLCSQISSVVAQVLSKLSLSASCPNLGPALVTLPGFLILMNCYLQLYVFLVPGTVL